MSYFKNKEVVVTGGAGFLATHFITELDRLGANITTHTYNSPLQVSEEIQKEDGYEQDSTTSVQVPYTPRY